MSNNKKGSTLRELKETDPPVRKAAKPKTASNKKQADLSVKPVKKSEEKKSEKKKPIGVFIAELRGKIQVSLLNKHEFTIADYVKAVELEREYKRTKTQSKREVVLRWEAFDPKKG